MFENPDRCPHCDANGRIYIERRGYETWYCRNCSKEIKKEDLK